MVNNGLISNKAAEDDKRGWRRDRVDAAEWKGERVVLPKVIKDS